MNEVRFQGGNGGKTRRASLEEVEGNMSGLLDAKALQDDLQSLDLTPSFTCRRRCLNNPTNKGDCPGPMFNLRACKIIVCCPQYC